MSSEGPYGRHGFNSNPSGYGGGAGSYSNPPQAGGYAAPSYGGGQGYGGASYNAPAPGSGGYGGPPGYDMVREKQKCVVSIIRPWSNKGRRRRKRADGQHSHNLPKKSSKRMNYFFRRFHCLSFIRLIGTFSTQFIRTKLNHTGI